MANPQATLLRNEFPMCHLKQNRIKYNHVTKLDWIANNTVTGVLQAVAQIKVDHFNRVLLNITTSIAHDFVAKKGF